MGAEEEILWVQLLWEQVKGAQGGSWSDLPTAFGTTYAQGAQTTGPSSLLAPS